VSTPAQDEKSQQREQPSKPRLEPLLQRATGVPGLFVAVYSAVGFSIYFSLGVVADRGLGLTPLIFLAAGLLFVITTLSYVEGGAMLRERGGSSSFARNAFNELIAFIAGWTILNRVRSAPAGWCSASSSTCSIGATKACRRGTEQDRAGEADRRPARHRPR